MPKFGDPKIKKGKKIKKVKKIKKPNKAKLLKKYKKQLWELCKQYCRLKWGNVCYACGKGGLSGGNWHTSHVIASCLCPFELDYSENNLRPGCYFCNIHAGGNSALVLEKLRQENGQEYIDNLFLMKNQPKIIKPSLDDYEDYIKKYEQMIKNLQNEL